MGFINAKNKVPDYQRSYQAAFRGHTRIWKINPRSRLLLTPYYILLITGVTLPLYGLGRKAGGYNTFW